MTRLQRIVKEFQHAADAYADGRITIDQLQRCLDRIAEEVERIKREGREQ